jgi:uncharacterized protein YndB with AHSA1/START domain
MSEYTVVREYPYPIEEVWAVLTEPDQVARWTTTGQGGRPEGFAAVPGTRFRFIGKPTIGWAGVVYCEMIAVDAPHSMHYTWKGDEETDDVTDVSYLLEETRTALASPGTTPDSVASADTRCPSSSAMSARRC